MKRVGFLFLSVFVAFSLFAGGTDEKSGAAAADGGGNESPVLAAKVASGSIPALSERLPDVPFVATVAESIGTYGGTMRLVSNEVSRLGDGRNGVTVASLTKADIDTATTIPHLAKEFYWEGSKTLVFVLREGTKWSDGEPLTTETVSFWWNDFAMNEELRPSGPPVDYVTPGGTMEVEIVDDYTFKLKFKDPKPLILETLAKRSEYQADFPLMPVHYLKKYHKKYAEAAELAEMVSAGGFEDWTQLFNSKLESYWDTRSEPNLGAPSLHSFVLTEIGPNYIKLERNPYYWKVDEAGNQLPYIDDIHIQIVGKELYHGKVAAGEADFAARRTDLKELALYKSGEVSGKYRVLLWNAVGDGDYMVLLNFNSPNAANQELIQNLKFRQALSIAIDREDFNNVINTGLALTQQMTLLPTSRFYKDEYAESWAQYDVSKANKMLDEMGLKWDSSHEFRIGPDGKKISFLLEEGGERPIEAAELLAEYWKAVGIDMDIKLIDRTLFHLHMENNEGLDVHITKYGMMDGAFIERPDMFLPVEDGGTDTWATLWARWRQNTYEGASHEVYEKPPEEVIRIIDAWEELKYEVDEAKVKQLADTILKSQSDNLWTLGITTGGVKPVIASNRLRNVLEKGTYTYDFLQYAQYSNADTWFISE
ncbi:MAG: ABC transporter substrate-binding protein [Spirochaetales bacterium]|jgi:peptide/nickel transport system substrate-binding protein|nr:ABC transporter substrate-binding protein [Spirochaetales bacterium]